MAPDPDAPLETLPRLCGECGYRLDGLPRAGSCPECGGRYGSHQFVLFGWAGQTKATFANSRAVRTTGFALLAAGALVGVAVLFLSQMRRAPVVLWVVAGAVAAYASYHYRRLRAAGTPPVQLRLSSKGVVQFDGLGVPDHVEPWEGRWRVRFTSLGGRRHRLVMEKVPAEWLEVPGRAVDFEFDAGPTAVTALR
jgi:hypothetical protein